MEKIFAAAAVLALIWILMQRKPKEKYNCGCGA